MPKGKFNTENENQENLSSTKKGIVLDIPDSISKYNWNLQLIRKGIMDPLRIYIYMSLRIQHSPIKWKHNNWENIDIKPYQTTQFPHTSAMQAFHPTQCKICK